MKLSIVIPVYNGAKTISKLVEEIKRNIQETSFEIVLVHDCGKDNSWEVIKKIKEENKDILKAVKLSRNFGQHNAILCGIKHSTGDFIITMDEDLQHDPKFIKNLIQKQKEGNYDLVYAKFQRKKHNTFRNITSDVLNYMLRLGMPDLNPNYTSFRLIRSNIAKQMLSMNNSYTFLDGYLSWITNNIGFIEIEHRKREKEKSSYTLKKLIFHALNIFFTFSLLPIRIVTFSSIMIFILTLIYSIYLVIRKLVFNDLIPGYTSIMLILGFGIGLILFALGIIGEYIHRINQKTTKRPDFFEKEIL